ncbi:MAG: S53 family peptidase [Planctomycetes bacterium]|nr:S53 family peptidase [Planctomycetota bacterium]
MQAISYLQTPNNVRPPINLKATDTSRTSKPYIQFPSPIQLRAADAGPWKVLDLCKAYDFPKNLGGGGVIGILELGGGWTQSDLDRFSQLNGMPRIEVTDVSLDGARNSPGGEADAEVLLDIETSAAAYYYATGRVPTIKVFWAENDFNSFEKVVDAAVEADCDVLSISWGADELRWEQGAPGAARSLEAVVQLACEKGLVVFAASGDNSSGDGDAGANVDMPSACPHVIGCGGTRKSRRQETVWGSGLANGQGTGGGFSRIFPTQAWQLNAPQDNGRMVPDVSADAAPATGYLVVINGQETPVGGTSAVAPLYAGLFASFGRKLGFVSPTLWQNPSDFTDIITGSNGSYRADIGPDPCTGLGVPKGSQLAQLFPGGHGSSQSSGNGYAPAVLSTLESYRAPAHAKRTQIPGEALAVNVHSIVQLASHTFTFKENSNTPGRSLEQSVVVNVPAGAGFFTCVPYFTGAFTTPDFAHLTERPLGQFMVAVGLRGNNLVCTVRLTDSNSDDPIFIGVTAIVVFFN